MKIAINKIKIADRIRKTVNNVEELAENIRAHGLITPIAVMPVDGGEYQLLAGLRRIRAMELNSEIEIDAKVFPASDAEAALKIEFFENEQREPFTLAEKMEYAAVIAEIERAKGKDRMSEGGKGGVDEGSALARNLIRNRTDAIVSDKVGMKETSYRYARYLAEKSPETIERIDNGEIALRPAYNEVRARETSERSVIPPVVMKNEPEAEQKDRAVFHQKTQSESGEPNPPVPKSSSQPSRAKKDPLLAKYEAEAAEATQKRQVFNALSPEGKIDELNRQLKEERTRAADAESRLAREKELRANEMYHYNGTIEMLRNQLAAAHARIEELEAEYEPDKYTD
jgi:hypothetical protein